MNLFNKTIAGLTAIALTVSGVLPVANVAQAAGWQQNAFDRNADLMPRVTNAASVSALEKLSTREEAIAFISRFIENYDFGLTYDASMNCDYTDAANIMSDLTDEVMAACEAGIIKSATTNAMVNPKALVTEGQFATMLARLVTGDPTMEEGDANAFLSDPNVMGQYAYTTYKGSNSLTKILALEMLRKLALALEEPTPVDCTMDPTMPECLPGTTGTMNTGTVVEVKAGNLDLTLGAGSPANGSSIPMNGVVTFAKVALAAGSSDVNVRSVTLRREGLGERTDFSRVYFEQNGVRISSRSSLTTDGMVTLSFTPALVVKANGTEVVDLVASLASSQAGSEHRFVVTAVDSSAVNATFSVTTPTLRTANYTVGAVTFTTGGVDTTIQGSETNYEIGRFRLDNVSNNDKVVKVKAITFRNAGDGDLTEGLMDIALYKNSTKVSNNVIINGREITFVLDNTELNASESSLFYIKANTKAVDSTAGDKYQFEIRNSEDLNAVESVTDFRVSVNGIPSTTALAEYTVKGGDLMITRDTSVATTNTVSPGQVGVILAKGTITARQPSNLEDLVTSITSSAALSRLVQKLTLRIGSSSATFTPPTTAGAVTNPVTFDGSFSVNGTTPFEITADLRASFSGNATMQLAAVQLTQFSIKEYLNGNQIQTNELIGTLSTVNVNVQKSVLSASRNDALSDRSVVRGSNELVIFGANLSTSTNSPITVNSLDFVAT